MRRIRLFGAGLLTIAGLIAALAATGAPTAAARAGAQAATVGCQASALSATFKYVEGSNGAGNLEYQLTIKNSGPTCALASEPDLRLINKSGQAQPTHVNKYKPGTATIAEGKSASVNLRFSADIPGPGEPTMGPCEASSFKVKVLLGAPASGSVTGPISPPTPVCEHGTMSYSKGL